MGRHLWRNFEISNRWWKAYSECTLKVCPSLKQLFWAFWLWHYAWWKFKTLANGNQPFTESNLWYLAWFYYQINSLNQSFQHDWLLMIWLKMREKASCKRSNGKWFNVNKSFKCPYYKSTFHRFRIRRNV